MKFKFYDSITNRNIEYAIKYLFDSDNISHQAIIIYQLNKLINNQQKIGYTHTPHIKHSNYLNNKYQKYKNLRETLNNIW